jgi:hypothetical protein
MEQTVDMTSLVIGPPIAGDVVLRPGDVVLVLGHATEEGPIVWIRGQRVVVEQFWDTVGERDATRQFNLAVDPSPGLEIQPLLQEWWVHGTYQGQEGWFDAFRSTITGHDGCAC